MGDLPDWVRSLIAEGLDPIMTSAGHCWVRIHGVARMRYPPNVTAPTVSGEKSEVLGIRSGLLSIAHRTLLPGESPNAYLYLSRDRDYGIEKLSANTRSKVRRGLRRHRVGRLSREEIRDRGYQCVVDTLSRNGLRPPTRVQFRARWSDQRFSSHRQLWAATAGDEIAAYMVVRRCGQWAEIEATWSADAHLRNFANHALFTTVLHELLSREAVESVSYGLTSAQLDTRASTLHSYKLSLGFEAVPVMREFHVHPILRLLINEPSRRALGFADRMLPGRRLIRKARALAEMVCGGRSAPLPEVR